MSKPSPARRYTCHWGLIDGPTHEGRTRRTLMWVCEYPYRTLRTSGPDENCEGCPHADKYADALQYAGTQVH
jgi:hypothetical protein